MAACPDATRRAVIPSDLKEDALLPRVALDDLLEAWEQIGVIWGDRHQQAALEALQGVLKRDDLIEEHVGVIAVFFHAPPEDDNLAIG